MKQHIRIYGIQRYEPDLKALVAALLLLIDHLSADELRELSQEVAAQPGEAA